MSKKDRILKALKYAGQTEIDGNPAVISIESYGLLISTSSENYFPQVYQISNEALETARIRENCIECLDCHQTEHVITLFKVSPLNI